MASGSQASSSKERQNTVLKPKSIVWKLFNINEQDDSKAICTICKLEISRGTKPRYTTTNMLSHLKSKHNKEIKNAEDEEKISQEKKRKLGMMNFNVSMGKKLKTTSTITQPTLLETLSKSKPWDVNDQRAIKIHKLIGEMIAVDLQPFSILEDIGFQRLMNCVCPNYQIPSRKYIKENIVKEIYKRVRSKVNEEINAANHISFTNDGWSASNGNHLFLSLTSHWINDIFQPKSAILTVKPFDVKHTASNICECLKSTMEEFQISDKKIHLIVRDNAANMTAGVRQAEYQSLGCFMHTLQLVLNDAIFEQRYVKDLVAVCKQIVGYFNHSPSAFAKFTEYQVKFNIPEHRFIQDVDTRWNSQYYMLARVLEQKTALIAYCSDNSKPSCLGTEQWKILEKLQQILKHFDDCTNFLSVDNAIASSIIPNIKAICHFFHLGESKGLFSGLGSTLSAWKVSVKKRFESYLNDKNLILATYLDPRFKNTFLAEKYSDESLLQWMTEDIISMELKTSSMLQEAESSDVSLAENKSDDEETETSINFNYDSFLAEFTKKKKKSIESLKHSQEESS